MADLNPIVAGSTLPAIAIKWVRKDGSIPNLSGATITARIGADSGTPAAFAGSGTVSITDGPNGKFTYKFSAADFTAMGTLTQNPTYFHIQFTADYGGGDKEISIPVQMVVVAAL